MKKFALKWNELAERANLDSEKALAWGKTLRARYGEPWRRYHDLRHVWSCLKEYENSESRFDEGDQIDLELAIWLHDVVYDPRRSDNEVKSAEFAVEGLNACGFPDEGIDAVARLILATRHTGAPSSNVEALLVDIDLATLGKSEAEYDRYSGAIREEYAHVPDEIYRPERSKVLRHFLDRDSIYSTAEFFGRYEEAARRNLSRELEALA